MNIQDIIGQYLESRSECIPLVASENAMSRAVRKLCSSEIAERYCVGPAAPWRYPREAHLEQIVLQTQNLASKILGGKTTTVAPLSGSQCVAAIVLGTCKPGDLVMGVSSFDGGHWALRGMADRMQCRFEPLPLTGRATVDCGKLKQMVNSNRPALVMVDQSHSIEAIPPESIRAVLPANVPLFYDLSHFMGLVPHKYLSEPFVRGVTVLHGSTHKSLFGPQKGMIVFGPEADADIIAKISSAAEKILSSNTHLHHVAALGQALKEHEAFGEDYAATVVKHARLFARSLQHQGLVLLSAQHSLTESHQVLARVDGNAEAVWNSLTAAGILANLIRLPREDAPGFRFGLAETARLGYSAAEIEELGLLAAEIISGRRDARSAKASVRELSRRPRSMRFCFEEEPDPPARPPHENVFGTSIKSS